MLMTEITEIETSRIQVLPDDVAMKIAAGEVIERPSSVVKELIENAFDSGATRVQIELEQGGRRLIRVTDNGSGMTPQEMVLALQRHATSKISCLEDLEAIRTLGFRGEALPSIAAVSRAVLVSRTPNTETGARLEVDAGQIVGLDEAAAPPGTSISVHDLFAPLPARRKFLKSDRTEASRVAEVVIHAGLSRPGAGIRLVVDGQTILNSAASADPINTISALLGLAVARELRPVRLGAAGVTVEGFAAGAALSRPTRSGQHLFVNGRWVRDRTLWHAVDDAYRGVLPSGRHAVLVLHLEVDPALVDVNVHPAKMEVRFLRAWEVHQAVRDSIRQALSVSAAGVSAPLAIERIIPAKQAAETPWLTPGPPAVSTAPAIGSAAAVSTGAPLPPMAAETEPPELLQPAAPPGDFALPSRPQSSPVPARPELFPAPAGAGFPRVLVQLWNSYILAEGEAGLLLFDQHLVHERILFEGLLGSSQTRPLLQPATIPLTHQQALGVDEALPVLQSLGFEIEPFGRDSFIVRATPLLIPPGRIEARLANLLEQVSEETRMGGDGDRLRRRLAAAAACRSAVRKGSALQLPEMQRLLVDLQGTRISATCPHGCPISIELTYAELLKRFHRT